MPERSGSGTGLHKDMELVLDGFRRKVKCSLCRVNDKDAGVHTAACKRSSMQSTALSLLSPSRYPSLFPPPQLSQSVGTPSAATASRRASTIAIGSAPRAHSSLTINPSRTYTSRRERERGRAREDSAFSRERHNSTLVCVFWCDERWRGGAREGSFRAVGRLCPASLAGVFLRVQGSPELLQYNRQKDTALTLQYSSLDSTQYDSTLSPLTRHSLSCRLVLSQLRRSAPAHLSTPQSAMPVCPKATRRIDTFPLLVSHFNRHIPSLHSLPPLPLDTFIALTHISSPHPEKSNIRSSAAVATSNTFFVPAFLGGGGGEKMHTVGSSFPFALPSHQAL